MDCKVIWTEPAIEDLRQIVATLAQTDPNRASQLGNAILDHTDLLAAFPLLGPVYANRAARPVRVIFTGSHHVFYRVLEAQRVVEIMHVRHGARTAARF